jgi:hypothetical protein
MGDSINWANSYSYSGLRGMEAERSAKNQIAEQLNSALKTTELSNTINIASDIAGLGEKGREFNEKINSYAKKINRTPPLNEGERAPIELQEVRDGDFQSSPLGEAEESRGLVSRALGLSEETADTLSKFGTKAAIIGTAGVDIYEDVKEGGIAGNNWEQKTENLGNIVGGALETAGMLVPTLAPELELGGVVISGIGDVIGDIGDLVDNNTKSEDLKKEQQTTKLSPSVPVQSIADQVLTRTVT